MTAHSVHFLRPLAATATALLVLPAPATEWSGALHPEYGQLPPRCAPVSANVPPWASGAHGQPFVADWLATSTTRCVDLPSIDAQNRHRGRHGEDLHILWRTSDGRLLFRGSGHGEPATEYPSVGDVFARGFVPRGAVDGALVLHPPADWPATALVSTSFDLATSWEFGNTVFVLDAPGGIDVDMTVDGVRAAWQDEIAFAGGVLPWFVRGVATKKGADRNGEAVKVFDRYVSNPGYSGYTPVPAGMYELQLSSSGKDGGALRLTTGEGVSHTTTPRLAGDVSVRAVRTTSPFAEPAAVSRWFVLGVGPITPRPDEDAACFDFPHQLQSARHAMLQAWTGLSTTPQPARRTSGRCVRLETFALSNGTMQGGGSADANGVIDLSIDAMPSWSIASPGATAHTAEAAATGSDALALDLHRRDGSLAGSRSSVSQGFQIDGVGSARFVLVFRAGSSPFPWCAHPGDTQHDGALQPGNQDVRVQFDATGEGTWRNEAIITRVPSRVHRPGAAHGGAGRMDPQWERYMVALPDVAGGKSPVTLGVRFASAAAADGCGALITDVQILGRRDP